MFGCVPESPISQIAQTVLTDPWATSGVTVKPQRRKAVSWTLANATISSEDVEDYRHWSVDLYHDLVYMCDRQPYGPAGGSACWVSMDAGARWIRKEISFTISIN